MNHYFNTIFYIVIFALQNVNAQSIHINIGTKFIIKSKILDEIRSCIISLPESYDNNSNKTYPIIILLDGITHFKTAVSTIQFMSSNRNRNNLMPESIVIAIENVDRERDLTVTKIKTKRKNTMGGGKKFLAFIEKELIPFIDKNYRTKTHRTLIGHSLGGLLAMNAYMDENSIFDAFLSIDPSIWWDSQMMQDRVDHVKAASFKKKLYIATANQGESRIEKNQKRHATLFNLFKSRAKDAQRLKLDYFKNEDH